MTSQAVISFSRTPVRGVGYVFAFSHARNNDVRIFQANHKQARLVFQRMFLLRITRSAIFCLINKFSCIFVIIIRSFIFILTRITNTLWSISWQTIVPSARHPSEITANHTHLCIYNRTSLNSTAVVLNHNTPLRAKQIIYFTEMCPCGTWTPASINANNKTVSTNDTRSHHSILNRCMEYRRLQYALS